MSGMWPIVCGTLTVLALGQAAAGALCPNCRTRGFDMDVGTCVECRVGRTVRGAFALCPACSGRLNQCEHCRAALAAAGPVPPEASAPTTQPDGPREGAKVPTTQPDDGPTPAARERADLLKAAIRQAEFRFQHLGDSGKPFYSLTLSVPDFMLDEPKPFDSTERITAAQGEKIVDLLLGSYRLNAAEQVGANWLEAPPAGQGYILRIAADKLAFAVSLGWDLKMLRELDAIRAVLDRDAARAMDRLLERMSGLRAQWESAEPKTPTTQPEEGVLTIRIRPDGFAVNGVEAKARADMEQAVRRLAGPTTAIVLIRPDAQVQWQEVLRTFNFLVELGYERIRWSVD